MPKQKLESKKSKEAPVKKKPQALEPEVKAKKKKAEKPPKQTPLAFEIGAASKGKSPKSVKDLKGASYNPRFITDKALTQLDRSMDRFGDLSGVVFNIATQVLVSGHQRMKIISTKDSKIVKKECKRDRQGTVATGHIAVKEEDGTITRVPYREVDWSNKMTELAGNIAANMSGGEFDQVKLGAVMHELERGQFDIELTGTDNWDLQKAIGKFKKSKESEEGRSGSGGVSGEEGQEEFESYDPSQMTFNAQCPKCKFCFNVDPKAKPVKQSKPAIVGKPEKKSKIKSKPKTMVKAKTKPVAKPAKKGKKK